LAYADFGTAERLTELLTPQSPQALQTAAVRALAQFNRPEVAKLLLAGWRSYSPAVRRETVDALLQRRERIDALLTAVASGQLQRGEIDRDKQQLLLNHPQGAIRDRAQEVLGGATSSDRGRVVRELSPRVLGLSGNADRGRELFTKKCVSCHKVGDVGHQVGPVLTSVQNKSAGDLLIAILDPNREAQPNFTVYTVVTQDGKLLNGIITSETAASLTLTAAEAKQETVLRSQIETLVSSGKSLMPEGLEKDFTPEQLADLIAFVQTIKPPPSSNSKLENRNP
jgi:putative heme-binding domain-containing protein